MKLKLNKAEARVLWRLLDQCSVSVHAGRMADDLNSPEIIRLWEQLDDKFAARGIDPKPYGAE